MDPKLPSQPSVDALFPMREFLANQAKKKKEEETQEKKVGKLNLGDNPLTGPDDFAADPTEDRSGDDFFGSSPQTSAGQDDFFGSSAQTSTGQDDFFGSSPQSLTGQDDFSPSASSDGFSEAPSAQNQANSDDFFGSSPTGQGDFSPSTSGDGFSEVPSAQNQANRDDDFFGSTADAAAGEAPSAASSDDFFGTSGTPTSTQSQGHSQDGLIGGHAGASGGVSFGASAENETPLEKYQRKHREMLREKEEASTRLRARRLEESARDSQDLAQERQKRGHRNRDKHDSQLVGRVTEYDAQNPWANIPYLVDLNDTRKTITRMQEVYKGLI